MSRLFVDATLKSSMQSSVTSGTLLRRSVTPLNRQIVDQQMIKQIKIDSNGFIVMQRQFGCVLRIEVVETFDL